MKQEQRLRSLEVVPIREVWKNEAQDFTPWLAEDIEVLGDAIGLEMEVQELHQDVGAFECDMRCRIINTGEIVVIENQFGNTDHEHLGKLMVYSAGLEATTIVWIAETFRDEHRAAIDWLNNFSSNDLNFLGVEIKLWKIGDSLPAPQFVIVSKPNDWKKAKRQQAISERKQVLFDYWDKLMETIAGRNGAVKPQKPNYNHWMDFAIGKGGFRLRVEVSSQKRLIRISLFMFDDNASAHFSLLENSRDAIHNQFGSELQWDEKEGKKACAILLEKDNTVLDNKDDWPSQHQWVIDNLERFQSVFRDRIKNLNAADYAEDDMDNIRVM